MKIELLAPAKDKKTAYAAIDSGADAIYIGAPAFGARKKAANSLDDIKEIVDYAHEFYVKVYVTLNTILTDDELKSAMKLIHDLYKIGVDAVIIQDMGIIEAAIEGKLPPIPLHASTQCDNRTSEKVKFFKEIGISRVILARELSLEQIAQMPKDIELEAFVHGALCVSYSGQCYFSAANGGRSANRGECAQPCRKKYSLVDSEGKTIVKDKYLLNLCDFNASVHLKDLIKAGVTSFKIEGRLKDENYVRNVVSYYRQELDKIAQKTSSGKVVLDFEPDVNKTFNRGYTDYFLSKRGQIWNFDTPKFMGEEVKDISKLHQADGLCCLENGELRGCSADKIPPKTKIYRNFDYEFNKKLTNSRIKRQIEVEIGVNKEVLQVADEDGNRAEIALPVGEPAKNPQQIKETFIKQLSKTGDGKFYVSQIAINGNLPFLPVAQINELRRQALDLLMNERLKNYKREVQKPLNYAPFPIKNLDYRANIHNTSAKNFYEKCDCEVMGMSFESGNDLTFTPELMRTKHCLKFAFDMCGQPETLFLVDEKGKKYPLEFDCANCEMVIKSAH